MIRCFACITLGSSWHGEDVYFHVPCVPKYNTTLRVISPPLRSEICRKKPMQDMRNFVLCFKAVPHFVYDE